MKFLIVTCSLIIWYLVALSEGESEWDQSQYATVLKLCSFQFLATDSVTRTRSKGDGRNRANTVQDGTSHQLGSIQEG